MMILNLSASVKYWEFINEDIEDAIHPISHSSGNPNSGQQIGMVI